MSSEDKIYISWSDLEKLVEVLCEKISQEKYSSIYGIPRGGLIPAVLVSHKLGIPVVDKIYDNTIVIDDICDSGLTLNNKHKYTATLHYRKTSVYKPTYYASELDNDNWIVYPWEMYDSLPIQDYKL
jgi:hypothetical protein